MPERYLRRAVPPQIEEGWDKVAALSEVHRPASYHYRLVDCYVGGGIKRLLDIVASAAALLALAPALALIAIAIRFDSPGPALFQQRRTGFRGRAFYIYKFRTMNLASSGDQVRQATRGDGRVTMLGGVLRRTSLDELPQLLNVLRGEMSIVGPRPHALAHDEQFFLVDSAYPHRFIARPGITGLAQISGARGLTDTPEKVRMRLRHDLAYVDNWSLWGDFKIIVKTCLLVFGDKHAF